MTLEFGSNSYLFDQGDRHESAITWYERVMHCKLLYRADEIGWCELATPMAGVNIGLSQVESVVQGGGATNVFEVADIDAASASRCGRRATGRRHPAYSAGEAGHLAVPHGNAFMFSRSEAAGYTAVSMPSVNGRANVGDLPDRRFVPPAKSANRRLSDCKRMKQRGFTRLANQRAKRGPGLASRQAFRLSLLKLLTQ